MKSEFTTRKSAAARLNLIKREADNISSIQQNLHKNGFDGELMQQLRDAGENLLQSIHEYNAYSNVIRGDCK